MSLKEAQAEYGLTVRRLLAEKRAAMREVEADFYRKIDEAREQLDAVRIENGLKPCVYKKSGATRLPRDEFGATKDADKIAEQYRAGKLQDMPGLRAGP